MRKSMRLISGGLAVAIIVYGLFLPVTAETGWLLCLWAAALLGGVALWLSQTKLPRHMSRSVYNLGLFLALGFVVVGVQLLRQQVTAAEATYNRIESDANGQTISNVRPVLASQRILRGKIIDRAGLTLVGSDSVNGFARRTYPLVDQFDPAAFSNIVGYFSPRFGQSGLEATYSAYLSGERDSPLTRLRDDLLGRTRVGSDLYLTLDARLQARIAGLLGGRKGSVVVLNPQTGAVLAMVSVPGYNPAELSFNPGAASWDAENERIGAYWDLLRSDAAGQPLINRAAQGQYPPGSTFKTVTAVAALEHAGAAQPDNIRCLGQLDVETGAPPVVNAVEGLAGLTGDPSNLERVYAFSCNVAFAQYALRLGADRLGDTARAFDIFSPPNVPEAYDAFEDLLSAPSRLYVQPGFLSRPLALADTGYGQGQMLVTPLQMAMVAAAIANDGVMMRPYLVERVVNPEGQTLLQRKPEAVRRVMSPETAQTMLKNMHAVARYGFGSVISEYLAVPVGGKSGTAEHAPGAVPHAWFIAVAPLDNPQFAVAVMVESGGEGSSVGGTLAGQVLQAAFEVFSS